MKIIKRILLLFLLLTALLIGTIFVIGYINYDKAVSEVSIEEKLRDIRSDEHYVTYDNISEELLDATVAIEDRRFYQHGGVDIFSTCRAFVQNIFAKDIVGGGSTITQQLAKNMYFGYQASFTRKVSELFVAWELENQLDKKEILELYVNIINYGDGHIGIYEASQGYFQKNPSELTLDEASLLAGLPQSPSNYQLSDHSTQARIRQQQVLQAMVENDYIQQMQMDEVLTVLGQ